MVNTRSNRPRRSSARSIESSRFVVPITSSPPLRRRFHLTQQGVDLLHPGAMRALPLAAERVQLLQQDHARRRPGRLGKGARQQPRRLVQPRAAHTRHRHLMQRPAQELGEPGRRKALAATRRPGQQHAAGPGHPHAGIIRRAVQHIQHLLAQQQLQRRLPGQRELLRRRRCGGHWHVRQQLQRRPGRWPGPSRAFSCTSRAADGASTPMPPASAAIKAARRSSPAPPPPWPGQPQPRANTAPTTSSPPAAASPSPATPAPAAAPRPCPTGGLRKASPLSVVGRTSRAQARHR